MLSEGSGQLHLPEGIDKLTTGADVRGGVAIHGNQYPPAIDGRTLSENELATINSIADLSSPDNTEATDKLDRSDLSRIAAGAEEIREAEPRLPKTLRHLGIQAGKTAKIILTSSDTENDRAINEKMPAVSIVSEISLNEDDLRYESISSDISAKIEEIKDRVNDPQWERFFHNADILASAYTKGSDGKIVLRRGTQHKYDKGLEKLVIAMQKNPNYETNLFFALDSIAGELDDGPDNNSDIIVRVYDDLVEKLSQTLPDFEGLERLMILTRKLVDSVDKFEFIAGDKLETGTERVRREDGLELVTSNNPEYINYVMDKKLASALVYALGGAIKYHIRRTPKKTAEMFTRVIYPPSPVSATSSKERQKGSHHTQFVAFLLEKANESGVKVDLENRIIIKRFSSRDAA